MRRKPNIVTTIKVRMSDERTAKKVFLGKPGRRRKTGKPKLWWLDCIENDLKLMGVKRLRKKAEDRSVYAITYWLNRSVYAITYWLNPKDPFQ
jgi:hypothetical protein